MYSINYAAAHFDERERERESVNEKLDRWNKR